MSSPAQTDPEEVTSITGCSSYWTIKSKVVLHVVVPNVELPVTEIMPSFVNKAKGTSTQFPLRFGSPSQSYVSAPNAQRGKFTSRQIG